MDFDEIEHLRSKHAAWALLRSQNVGLVLGFLGRVFIDANASGLPASRLISELDDELFASSAPRRCWSEAPPAEPLFARGVPIMPIALPITMLDTPATHHPLVGAR